MFIEGDCSISYDLSRKEIWKWNPFQKGDGRGFRLAIADLPPSSFSRFCCVGT